MRKIIVPILIILFSCGICMAEAVKIDCAVTRGKISLLDAGTGGWVEKSGTIEVRVGDKIRIPADASVFLNYSYGTVFNLTRSSEIEIKADGLLLNEGGAWIKFIKKNKKFTIETPKVVADVRGNIFGVFHKNDKSVVCLSEGLVKVRDKKSGKTVNMKSTETIYFGSGDNRFHITPQETKTILGSNPYIENGPDKDDEDSTAAFSTQGNTRASVAADNVASAEVKEEKPAGGSNESVPNANASATGGINPDEKFEEFLVRNIKAGRPPASFGGIEEMYLSYVNSGGTGIEFISFEEYSKQFGAKDVREYKKALRSFLANRYKKIIR